MAVKRNVWQRITGTKSGSGNCTGGFEWRISNTEEDAKTNLRNTIQIRMWFKENSSMTTYNYTTKESRYEYKIGNNSNKTAVINTRYDFKQADTGTIYYLTSSYPFKRMSGAATPLTINVPINPDTGISEQVIIGTFFEGRETEGLKYISTLNKDITSQIPTIEVSKKVKIKVNGKYKDGEVYIKRNDTWTKSNLKLYVKVNNTWKEV